VQEAVNIRRKLAEQRPDAFLPDLARSLGVLALSLQAPERTGEAHAALAEAIGLLTPYFLQNQSAFRGMMGELARHYLQLSKVLNCDPDIELLTPLLPHLTEGENDG
jgi:hypothetical protein